jgi:hypothetical protein
MFNQTNGRRRMGIVAIQMNSANRCELFSGFRRIGPAGIAEEELILFKTIDSGRPSEDLEFFHVDDPRIKRCLLVRHELRRASNEATLRAFRNADRFTTFEILR